MQDNDVLARLAAADVLSGLYEAIADHTQFDSLLGAMDDFLDADPDGLERGDADWKTMFRLHFSRAGQFLESDQADTRESPIVFVDRQVVPAAIINRNLEILAANALLNELPGGEITSLETHFATPNDAKRLQDLFRSNDPLPPALISFTLPNLSTPVFVVASRAPVLDLSGETGPLVVIKVARATWNPDLVPLLERAYGLTLAEIEILEGLVERGSVTSIAKLRKRSVRTVRTQLTNIFAKLGLTSQTELALFLATLTQLMTKERSPSNAKSEWLKASSEEIERCSITAHGRPLSYIKYGDPNGTPVLLVHTTTPPDMTLEFRRECAKSGVRVIAVHKPGSGGYVSMAPKDGPKKLAADYATIMDAEDLTKAIIAGHCSSGLYALEFAKAYPERSLGLILIDTGMPFLGRKDLMALPKSLRRTFLPARYLPEVLLVPHRIFAANFRRSTAGEARVVDYFFQDNQADRYLTRTDRNYYEITRQIIDYSFEDIDRLVADVCRWAKDWSHLLDIVSEKPLIFVHGDQNRLFEHSKIIDFCKKNEMSEAVFSKNMGQLQIYQNPSAFSEAVALIQKP